MSRHYYEDYAVGDLTRSEPFRIGEAQVRAYLAIVGDDHAAHNDRAFCWREFGRPDLVVPGMLTLAFADSLWARLVTPSKPFSPHYGHDRIRYLNPLFTDEEIYCTYELKEKKERDERYGALFFETYVRKTDDTPVIFETDIVLVRFRNSLEERS